MNYFLLITTSFLLLTGCKNENRKNAQRPTSPKEKQSMPEDTSTPAQNKFKPDTTVGQISLLNSKNVANYLGTNVTLPSKDKNPPQASVVSSDANQRLVVYFQEDEDEKEILKLLVHYTIQNHKDDQSIKDSVFQTESGIKLGMSMQAVKSLKGRPNSQSRDKTVLLHYEVTDFENSDFLNRYDLPVYYADYKFDDDQLVSFSFGFEKSNKQTFNNLKINGPE